MFAILARPRGVFGQRPATATCAAPPKRRSSGTVWTGLLFVGLLLLATTGCGSTAPTPPAAPGPPDLPVPADEPRAELSLRLSLPPAYDCEEQFDLALYRQRGIELIEWDEPTSSCEDRIVTVHYLPNRMTSEQLLAATRPLTTTVTVATPSESQPDDSPPAQP